MTATTSSSQKTYFSAFSCYLYILPLISNLSLLCCSWNSFLNQLQQNQCLFPRSVTYALGEAMNGTILLYRETGSCNGSSTEWNSRLSFLNAPLLIGSSTQVTKLFLPSDSITRCVFSICISHWEKRRLNNKGSDYKIYKVSQNITSSSSAFLNLDFLSAALIYIIWAVQLHYFRLQSLCYYSDTLHLFSSNSVLKGNWLFISANVFSKYKSQWETE